MVREEVREVEITWVEDGDSNEELSLAEVETLDEAPQLNPLE